MTLGVTPIGVYSEQLSIMTKTDNRSYSKIALYTSEMARKGPGSIADGLNIIQQLLLNTSEGREKGLRFYKGLREGFRPDAKLVRNHKPLDTITEMRNLQYRTEEQKTGTPQDDLPVGRDKHGIDAFRYWCLWRFESQNPLGFGSGGARRAKRL